MSLIVITFCMYILSFVFVTYGHILKCPADSFILENMTDCHQLLTCGDIKQLTVGNRISVEGNVKDVFLSRWGSYDVVLLKLKNRSYENDFKFGLQVLQHLNNDSGYVVQLIGECSKFNYYVTEYHKLGDGRKLVGLLSEHIKGGDFQLVDGLKLCIRYVEILHYLHHNNPLGRLVVCDSNELTKLLSQMLITNELKLIFNDMDALAVVRDQKGILCGCRNLTGDFVAPEQRRLDHPAACRRTGTLVTGYNEKIDIWKIPDVCDHFLKVCADYKVIKYHLFDIHKQCKNKDYWKRPNTKQVLSEYRRILKQLSVGDNDLLYEHDDL